MLAAQPDQSILKQLAEADGSPFLVVETLLGLQEEERIRVVDGRAELIDGQLPRRVHEKMRERLGRLSDEASDAVTVAASLGRTFTFDELARTLGRPASDLLAPVGELLEANLLVERDEKLAFWHDITREAVRASVPVTARRALDRQAAGVLLEAGALPVEVAVQLAASAEPGDEVAITTLLDAAKALVTTDPGTAAQFGQRALEIAPAHHPQRGEIVGTTAIALHIAGNSEQAIAFADRALRETLPALQEAEVRLSIAGMFAISPEIRIGAGRLALNLPDLPETLRARHLACLFHNLVTAGRIDEARAVLEETRAAVESADDARATFTLRVAESALEYTDDRFGPSLELITSAYRDGIFAGDDQRLRLAHMWHGELLSVADRYDEALAIAADGLAAAQRDRQGWAYQMFETWHGRMLLRTGRLSEALAVLEGRFALEDGTHAAAVLDAAGIVALGRLAIHTGDTRQARRLADIAQVMLEQGTPAVRRHAGWLLALFAMAEGDAEAARGWLRAPTEPDGRAILPRFPLDIADEVLLARIGLATHDDELAQLALPNSRRRAELNPGVASIAATAAHVRGLLEPSHADLREAVDLFERTPRRLELAAALEDLGVELIATDREAAIDALGRTLALYTRARRDLGRPPRPQPPPRARRAAAPRRRRARDERLGGADDVGAHRRAPRRRRADESRGRRTPLRLAAHRQQPSPPRVLEARHQLARGAGATCARLRDRLIVRCRGPRRRDSRGSHSTSPTKCCSRASHLPHKTTSSRSSRSPTAGGERSSTPASTRSPQRRLTSAVCSSGTTRISERRSTSSSAHRGRSSWRPHSKTSARSSPRPTAKPPSTSSAVPSPSTRSWERPGMPAASAAACASSASDAGSSPPSPRRAAGRR